MKNIDLPHKFNSFDELLQSFTIRDPELPALIYEQYGAPAFMSRTDLAQAVYKRAEELRSQGRTCLGVFCDGSLSCITTIFASALLGMQTVLLDENASDDLLRQQIQGTDIDLLWSSDEDLAQELSSCLTEGISAATAGDSAISAATTGDSAISAATAGGSAISAATAGDSAISAATAGGSAISAATAGDSAAASNTVRESRILFFTSGTTASSKAVVLTDKSLMAAAYNGSYMLPLSPNDTLMCMLPLNHVFGFVCGLLWGMECGAPVALGRGARHYTQDFDFFRPTVLSAVPLLLNFLVQHKLMNRELRLILVGAGDCPEQLLRTVQQQGVQISFGYGLTETSSGVAISVPGSPDFDPYALDICPEDTVMLAPDDEILISTKSCMMKGYYKNPEDTAAVLEDGVLYTGDLGRWDEEGRLHIIGRKKEILVLQDGTKIFLPEYEANLAKVLPGRDFTVFEKDGRPALLLVNKESASWPDLMREAAPAMVQEQIRDVMAELPRGQQLSTILFTDRPLPRTATGKVKRWELKRSHFIS